MEGLGENRKERRKMERKGKERINIKRTKPKTQAGEMV